MRNATLALAAIVAFGLAFFIFVEKEPPPPVPPAEVAETEMEAAPPPAVPPVSAAPPATPKEISPRWQVYQAINAEGASAQEDVMLMGQLLRDYHGYLKGLPYGGNKEFTQALLGQNRLKEPFLAVDHPAVSAQGELIDRWGTPYFLHPVSEGIVEVKSAGPDQQMWTEDDVDSVLTGSLQQQLERGR